jgi:farnesyl diphosphate synthase
MTEKDAGATFRQRLDAVANDIESLLERLLGDDTLAEELARPKRLMDAMRHVALGGGKRLRPFLVVETAALFSAPRERALMAGAALECVHCYSLAHDDLPAMDNDDMRRGRPTAHKAFDEATAILAGDGLLTLAFDILARIGMRRCDPNWCWRWRAMRGLAAWWADRCLTSPPKAASTAAR